jgi:hypothetical protein
MNIATACLVVACSCSIAACATTPVPDPDPKGQLTCSAPGTRCDYDGQCCSQMCDAYDCRGPAPLPTGAALHSASTTR